MAIGIDQVKLLTSMSDPVKLDKLKSNGMPTIDLATIKEIAEQKVASQLKDMTSNLSSTIGTLMNNANKAIEDKMAELESAGKAISTNVSSVMNGRLTGEIEKIKQAREHAMSTGNFVPLLAILNPDISLKNLQKNTVVLPSIPSIPSIPGIPKLPSIPKLP